MAIRTGRRGAEVDNFRGGERRAEKVPAIRYVVVPFIKQNKIDEIRRKLLQPLVLLALKLVNVRDHDISIVQVRSVRLPHVCRFGIWRLCQDVAFRIEAIRVHWFKLLQQLRRDIYSRRDHKRADGVDGKRAHCYQTRFAAANGENHADFAFSAGLAKMLLNRMEGFALGFAELLIVRNLWIQCLKLVGFDVRSVIVSYQLLIAQEIDRKIKRAQLPCKMPPCASRAALRKG
ncbi:MAG TPA: hypothetical protein VIY69_07750 [Candidatus Acidoferrales bacterium]